MESAGLYKGDLTEYIPAMSLCGPIQTYKYDMRGLGVWHEPVLGNLRECR